MPACRPSARARGYFIASAAIITISPDALLLRLCEDEEPLLITSMRTAWLFVICWLTLLIQQGGGVKRTISLALTHRKPLALVGCCSISTSLGFALSLQLTEAAEALLLIALNPLWAALIGWRWLGDTLPLRTRVALDGAMASIAVVFLPRIFAARGAATHGAHAQAEERPLRLLGDAAAFVTGLGLAGFANAVRNARTRHTDVPVHFAQVVANALVALLSLCLGAALGRPLALQRPARALGLTCLMGVMINCAYIGFNLAPKYITAAEFAVISLLETILGPIWVFCATHERPSHWTLGGGALLIATLLVHEIAPHVHVGHRAGDGRASAEQKTSASGAHADGGRVISETASEMLPSSLPRSNDAV